MTTSPQDEPQRWLWLAALALAGWLFYRLAPVLTPFLFSALLAYLGDPLVDRIEARRLPRSLGVVLVFGGFLLLALCFLLVLIPVLGRESALFAERAPQAVQWLHDTVLPRLQRIPGLDTSTFNLDGLKAAVADHWKQVGDALSGMLRQLSSSGGALISWITWLFLIPVVTFYLLRDWDILVTRVHDLLPRRIEPVVVQLVRECDEVLAQFLRGQILVMLGLAVIYALGLWIVGVDLAFLIGLIAGLVSFVPYLGAIVGVLLSVIAAAVQFGDTAHVVYVLVVFGFGQTMEGMVLSPLLVGERIGLHPVAVMFAVMAGGQLFGFFGVLVALPVAAVVVVLLRHSHDQYLHSRYYTP